MLKVCESPTWIFQRCKDTLVKLRNFPKTSSGVSRDGFKYIQILQKLSKMCIFTSWRISTKSFTSFKSFILQIRHIFTTKTTSQVQKSTISHLEIPRRCSTMKISFSHNPVIRSSDEHTAKTIHIAQRHPWFSSNCQCIPFCLIRKLESNWSLNCLNCLTASTFLCTRYIGMSVYHAQSHTMFHLSKKWQQCTQNSNPRHVKPSGLGMSTYFGSACHSSVEVDVMSLFSLENQNPLLKENGFLTTIINLQTTYEPSTLHTHEPSIYWRTSWTSTTGLSTSRAKSTTEMPNDASPHSIRSFELQHLWWFFANIHWLESP